MNELETLDIKATSHTPEIYFSPEENSFSISGVSIPEDTPSFYKPVFDLFNNFIQARRDNLTMKINLVHFNSSSSKVLFNLFKLVTKLQASCDVEITWYCDPDDDDMYEIIEDFVDVLGLDIEVKMLKMDKNEI